MRVVKDVVCPFCGCLCDDLELEIEGREVKAVRNACAVGEAKFLHYGKHERTKPMIRKNGELVEVSLDEAIRKAAEILAEAKYPVLFGWSSTSCEAVRIGLQLAEEVGAIIDHCSSVCHGPSVLAIQEVGLAGFTLGQSRHRFDLIIYWGSNPLDSHFRHFERYSTFSEGRFRPSISRRSITQFLSTLAERRIKRVTRRLLIKEREEGFYFGARRAPSGPFKERDRKLIVVDVRRTRAAKMADFFLQVKPNTDYEIIQALRMLIRDLELDVDEVAGIPVEVLEELADILVNAKVGVLYFGVGLTMSKGKHRNIEAAISLVRDLNARAKFHILPMRGHYNVTGADVVITWTTGYPYAVDLTQGYPRYNPGETSTIDVLLRDDCDAFLCIASDPVAHFPRRAVENMLKHPLIAIDPVVSATTLVADVVIPSAFSGIEVGGTAYRMDHVPITLKKVFEPPEGYLPDEEILKRILAEVRRIKGKAAEALVPAGA